MTTPDLDPLNGVSKAFMETLQEMDIEKERASFIEFAALHYPNGRRMYHGEFDTRFAAWLAAKQAMAARLQVAEDAAKGSAELIDTLTTALKAARVPIADDCQSFSTNRHVLLKIDVALHIAIAARRLTP